MSVGVSKKPNLKFATNAPIFAFYVSIKKRENVVCIKFVKGVRLFSISKILKLKNFNGSL